MNKNDIKALFPEGVETITISKNDYDRLYGKLTYENIILQSKIDKVIKLCETEKKYIYDYAGRDEKTGKLLKGNKIELDVVNKSKILDILKEDK